MKPRLLNHLDGAIIFGDLIGKLDVLREPSRKARDVKRLTVDKRREHKPDCVRERIERLVAGPYLELFARETKPRWDGWGDQVALFNHGPVPTRRQPSRLVDAPSLAP